MFFDELRSFHILETEGILRTLRFPFDEAPPVSSVPVSMCVTFPANSFPGDNSIPWLFVSRPLPGHGDFRHSPAVIQAHVNCPISPQQIPPALIVSSSSNSSISPGLSTTFIVLLPAHKGDDKKGRHTMIIRDYYMENFVAIIRFTNNSHCLHFSDEDD